jgi:hypothetical protein
MTSYVPGESELSRHSIQVFCRNLNEWFKLCLASVTVELTRSADDVKRDLYGINKKAMHGRH